ncbi:MAG: DUF3883 domain-containing protein [Chitinophagaceae bacterium]|nr:MAG: DUF3883 domain-containing protein [Chitinophagaceae bacterium]
MLEIEKNPGIHSLLYFEDLVPVMQFLNSSVTNLSEDKLSDDSSTPDVNVQYTSTIKTVARVGILHKSSVYTPGGRNGSDSKLTGNKAEHLVYEKLVELYGEAYVIHKSKETEWEHYDIKYSKDKGENWIYVEVKSASMNKFTLTIWEKNFGEGKLSDYEIWVYNNDRFLVLTDFYKSHPILNPTEFEVILDET